jgi:NAD(P)-dependent dehydrogenase (short-subunit alcohol dehydrogenase family)
MPDRFLEGRRAWVTGGATGMGHAIAIALAKAGADLAIGSLPASGKLPDAAYAARPDLGEIEAAAETIRALGVKCFAQGLDVREDASVDDFQHTAAKMLGGIDILINAAGVSAQEAMTTHRDETWTTVLDINLNGCYRTIRRCFPSMLERRWGRIINISSTAADVGFPRHAAYCASKSGLLGLTRCVALEGAEYGVTCNAINPGSVGTEMMRLGSLRRIAQGGQGATVEENFAMIADAMPQKRLIPAREIAATAVYLCRNEALGINGEAITVSGGALW